MILCKIAYKKQLSYSSCLCIHFYQGDFKWADFHEIFVFDFLICLHIPILVKVGQKQHRLYRKAYTCYLRSCLVFMNETGCVLRKVRTEAEERAEQGE